MNLLCDKPSGIHLEVLLKTTTMKTVNGLVTMVIARGGYHVRLVDSVGNNIAHRHVDGEWDTAAMSEIMDLARLSDQSHVGTDHVASIRLAIDGLLTGGLLSGGLRAEMKIHGDDAWYPISF